MIIETAESAGRSMDPEHWGVLIGYSLGNIAELFDGLYIDTGYSKIQLDGKIGRIGHGAMFHLSLM
jgi:hypothetical protein